MQQEKDITINEQQYRMKQLPLKPARALLIKVSNVLGPALGDAAAKAGVNEQTGMLNLNAEALGAGIRSLTTTLSDEDFEFVQSRVLANTYWLNNQGHYVVLANIADAHFGADLGTLMKLMWEYLQFQYGDFLKGLGLGGALQMMNPADHAPSTSTGTSGE